MIFVLELPAASRTPGLRSTPPTCCAKRLPSTCLGCAMRTTLGDGWEPADLASAALRARGDCRIYWTESEACRFRTHERSGLARPGGARWALRDQLVALDVLTDDL
jgi:hypothetical protein